MDLLLKLLFVIFIVCLIVWCGAIWGLWLTTQLSFLGACSFVFSSMATWLGGLTFWQCVTAVGLACVLLAPEETAELVADVGEVAGEAATQIGSAVGEGLGSFASASGLSTILLWCGLAVGAFFLLRDSDDKEEAKSSASKSITSFSSLQTV